MFERSWSPDGEPRAVVAILHGGGEHSGRYVHVAERLTAAGFRIDAFDQRSHGRSERVRGIALQCDDAAHLVADTAMWLAERDGRLPLFVIGHSMGGLVATALAIDGRLDVDGLIVLGPALRITPAHVMEQATHVAATEPDRVVVPMGRSGFDASSRDPAMKALIDTDPTHADVAGVPAQLLATTSALGSYQMHSSRLNSAPPPAMPSISRGATGEQSLRSVGRNR